jgi:hypothetical protein
MAKLDWDLMNESSFAPGCYRVEVAAAEEKTSKKGDPYLNLRLVALDFGRATLCFDIIMLAGKGARIGYTKLVELGVPQGTDEVLAASLVGMRAYVWVAHEVYDGKTRLKVFVDADGSACGYSSIDRVPEDYTQPGPQPEPAAKAKPDAWLESEDDDVPW